MFIQLYRATDYATSKPIEFRYKPCDNTDNNRKRPRTSSPCFDSDISGIVEQNAQYRSQSNCHVQQHHDNLSGIEEVYKDMPELMNIGNESKSNFSRPPTPTILVTQTIKKTFSSALFNFNRYYGRYYRDGKIVE